MCLEESLFLHHLSDMKVLHTIRDTPPNHNGVFALSYPPPNQPDMYLAYPGSTQAGAVQIFDCRNLVIIKHIVKNNFTLNLFYLIIFVFFSGAFAVFQRMKTQ